MVGQPWTVRFSASYPRSLRFYEHRYQLLRRFEEDGLLGDFNVKPDRVSVRLGDAYHRVAFSTNRLDAAVLEPSGEVDRIDMALEAIWQAFELERVSRPQFSFQWLVPLDGNYSDLRKHAARSAFGVDSLNDFAVLSDGQTEEPASTYRLHVGIVQSAEIPPRLARVHATVAPPDEESPPSLWRTETLPAVALFADSVWSMDDRPDSVTALKELRLTTEEYGVGVVSTLMDTFDLQSLDE